MNSKKRIISLIFALSLFLTLVSGCKPVKKGESSNKEDLTVAKKEDLPTTWEANSEQNTFYQTSTALDPRVFLTTDFVKVHLASHQGSDVEGLVQSYINTVMKRNVQIDIGVAQDGASFYTSGQYDGTKHEDIILRKADGSVWEFGLLKGLPYILPTESWNNYLAAVALRGMEAGASGITFQEVGVFGDSGYEQAFRDEWKKFYGSPWPEDLWTNAGNYFKGQHLRNQLSTAQVKQIYSAVRDKYPNAFNMLANHTSMSYYGFTNAAGNHDLYSLDVVDAIEAQSWSNTMELPFTYNGKSGTRAFANGFFDYSYWANLGKQVGKPVYYITDPAGDGYMENNVSLAHCKEMYQHQIVAQLAFSSVNRYNSCVWPERATGYYGYNAPTDEYRTIINNIVAIQNQMYKNKSEISTNNKSIKVGNMVFDTACYQAGGPDGGANIDDQFSMFSGLTYNGVLVEAVPFGTNDSKNDILKDYDVLIASYDSMKPLNDLSSKKLKAYVDNGGNLIFFAGKGTYEDIDSWWKDAGFASPQDELLNRFGITTTGRTKNLTGTIDAVQGSLFSGVVDSINTGNMKMIGYDTVKGVDALYKQGDKTIAFEKKSGKGNLIYFGMDPIAFRQKNMGDIQFKLVQEIASKKLSKTVESRNYISYLRGNLYGYNAINGGSTTESGKFINMFDENLSIVENLKVSANDSVLLLDVAEKMKSNIPKVLFAAGTNPTIAEYANITRIVTDGPSKSFGVTRVYIPDGFKISSLTAVDPNGNDLLVDSTYDSATKSILIKYKNHINKVIVDVEYTY